MIMGKDYLIVCFFLLDWLFCKDCCYLLRSHKSPISWPTFYKSPAVYKRFRKISTMIFINIPFTYFYKNSFRAVICYYDSISMFDSLLWSYSVLLDWLAVNLFSVEEIYTPNYEGRLFIKVDIFICLWNASFIFISEIF